MDLIVVPQDIRDGLKDLTSASLDIVIRDKDTYILAGEYLVANKELKKKIQAFFAPVKEAAHKTWKMQCDMERQALSELAPAEEYLSKIMAEWNIEQERIRQGEENKLRLELQKIAEEQVLQEALYAKTLEEAEAILNEPVITAMPSVSTSTPKISGLSMREDWTFEIENENMIPREYMTPDLKKIGAVVKALKSQTRIPGIKVVVNNKMKGTKK